MKKYIVSVIALFVVHNCWTMELAIIPNTKKFDDEAYSRVAQYLKATENKIDSMERDRRSEFLERDHDNARGVKKYWDTIEFIKSIPELTNPGLNIRLSEIDQNVKDAINFFSSRNECIFISTAPDVLTALFKAVLPKNFKDKIGMFSSRSHCGTQAKVMLHGEQSGQVINDLENNFGPELFSREQMVGQLDKMPIIEALSFLGWINQQNIATVTKKDSAYQGSLKVEFYQQKIAKVYFFEKSDLLKMNKKEEYFVRSILSDRTDLQISDDIVEKLFLLKDLNAFKADIYRTKKIKITDEKIANWEVAKNLIVSGAPFCVMSIMPEMVFSQTNSILQGLVGSMAGSYLVGSGMVPLFQAFHSDVCKKRKWFGFTNHMKVKNGGYFLLLNLLNCVCMATSQFIFSYGSMPCYVLGGLVYLTRAWIMALTCYLMETEENRIARGKNRNGLSYTLGDIFDGPKFGEK